MTRNQASKLLAVGRVLAVSVVVGMVIGAILDNLARWIGPGAAVLLVAVVALICWDYLELRWGRSESLSRDKMTRGFTPGTGSASGGCLLAAAIAATIGVLKWRDPPHPPFTGRMSWVAEMIYEGFGPPGIPVFLGGAAAMFLMAALAMREKEG